VAAYYVDWYPGRTGDHKVTFDLILGEWGDGTSTADRVLVALEYRLLPTGPAFMVIDAEGRLAPLREIAGRALRRSEVMIGQPIRQQAFAVADAVLVQDARVAELLGDFRLT
jgi:hypothetical protein